ncbi:MAG: GNAT family N-acetyltransferase [Lachnospiraceae bacterium]|nr:GNAT family N-acetyltransferase [Lachnospiraceae bacterium]
MDTRDRRGCALVRAAVPEDLEMIAWIEAVCFPPEEAAGMDELYRRFRAFPENFFVADVNGKTVGFINGCTTDQPVLKDELYHDTGLHKKEGGYQTVFGLDVLPEYQRQGIAAQLIHHLIEVSRMRQKTGIILTCKDRLVPYYGQFGFQWKGISASVHGGVKWNDMLLLL